MEHRVKCFLMILTLATLAQYSAQDSSSSTDKPQPVTNRVTVEVFYEGYSEESKKFIHEQLIPTNKELSDSVDIKLMPFAMGHVEKLNATNFEYITNCGETKSLCLEDKVHACAIDNIKKGEEKLLEFINCTMDSKDGNNEIIKNCGDKIKLEPNVIENISNCFLNKTSIYTLLDFYEKYHTNANINSELTVIVADKKNNDDVKAAKADLKKAVCQSIPEPKPSQCNGADAIIAGVLPLLIGAYFFIKSF